jgi:hypothetical protein
MPDVTMTINENKTISLSTMYLGAQGEHVDVLVDVDSDVSDLGYQAYVDFLLPSGLSYYKGGYDCSSGSFSMGLGELDSVMDKDGEVLIQFWVGTIVANVKTMHWATAVKKAYVNKSVGATSAAILPYTPQMVYPDTYPAENISIEDSATIIAATNAEQAFNELAVRLNNLLNIEWPIGSIRIGTDNVNPGTYLGGTWVIFGAGRVLVGIDSSDADFDTVEETIGEKEHILTYQEIPDVLLNKALGVESGEPGYFPIPQTSGYGPTQIGIDGGGLAHNNIQPSIVVRMWKRTA